jgi:hypothetical protein
MRLAECSSIEFSGSQSFLDRNFLFEIKAGLTYVFIDVIGEINKWPRARNFASLKQ